MQPHSGGVSDIPRRAVTRTAKLAALPLGVAGRSAVGLGRRLGGRPAELVTAELQQRTAEQLFRVLGELKGGAMKVGQALSVFEAALPEDLAAPYRAALTRLQDAAPALPAAQVHAALDDQLGRTWRDRLLDFGDRPAASASIGQVHRARWVDGRAVAVKVQYPGAGAALMSDLAQLGRLSRVLSPLVPGLDVRALVSELRDRLAEELDYVAEGRSQEAFATAYDGDPDIAVPHVLLATPRVLVTEWVDGVPLATVVSSGTTAQRDRAGLLLARFLYDSPARVGLLHADPHPGNFRLLDDGRLGVLDFGAVARLPGGLPPGLGRIVRAVSDGNADEVERLFRDEGFLGADVAVEPGAVLDYVAPLLESVVAPEFTFTRDWLRRQAARVADPRSPSGRVGRRMSLPPDYLLVHRVASGTTGVLCQLGASGAYRDLAVELLPGLAPPAAGRRRRPAAR